MILFKCSCGTGLRVSDEQAGQRFICPACMQEVSAPEESNPDCVLIYQEGGPADGFVIDRADLEDKITNRELGAWDLIWSDENWVPLGHVYEFSEEIPPKEDDSCQEIALHFSELPAIEGYSVLPQGGGHAVAGEYGMSDGQTGEAAGIHQRSFREKVLLFVKIAAVTGLLIFAFYRVLKMTGCFRNSSAERMESSAVSFSERG